MKYLLNKTVRYLRNILLGFDVLLNVFTGGNPREYVSQRLGRWKSRSKIAKAICNIMTKTFFGALHCERAHKEPGEGEVVNDTPLYGLTVFVAGIGSIFYLLYK